MITFTKEQLIASAHARIEFAEMMLAGELEPLTERTLSIELELSRRALASLGAEPVAFVMADDLKDSSIISTPAYRDLGEAMERTVGDVVALYASPLAPVSVHDERYQHLSEIYHAQEKRLFKLAQRIKGPSFDKYAYSPSQAIDVLESAIFGESAEEDSLAAMLQGADGNSPVIPDGGEHGFCQKHPDTMRLTHPYIQLMTYPPRPSTYCPKCDPEVVEWVERDKQLRQDGKPVEERPYTIVMPSGCQHEWVHHVPCSRLKPEYEECYKCGVRRPYPAAPQQEA